MSPTTGLQDVSARAGVGAPDQRLHVAIIMDGNGRWAKQRGMPRVLGHRAGVNALKRTVEGAQSQNVGVLTVFGFSTENWRRPAQEVSELMGLLKAYVESDLERLARAGVKVRIIGRRAGLSPDIAEVIERAEKRTAQNTEFVLQVAFNYGGQADIADAARAFAEKVVRGEARPEDLTEESFGQLLSTAAAPPPDLIVRTSGERRISNFLLWDSAYAELVFQDVLWPDYGPEALAAAIAEYRRRDRRYGGVAADDVAVAG
ncbi:di-trans,poly-cis-decaprenylcistransferase [Caulobacter segnis]|uniref:Isoprenyl transferase n=2 Tax=Caulobacter segnis TaxID=88688 RepID=D5VJZ0_CAUST|nr:polyprenyl diphosphate synthase [Caulobacter segnis]ADG10669.1 undecaprenyl diphosphate synthase [Caulobacter segnis ATCC 21756]AVQ02382.1 di-trans,poly-cis-decaprenylcistransferase [Caulobacter segnis]